MRVLIPLENDDAEFAAQPAVCPVSTLEEAFAIAFDEKVSQEKHDVVTITVCTN